MPHHVIPFVIYVIEVITPESEVRPVTRVRPEVVAIRSNPVECLEEVF